MNGGIRSRRVMHPEHLILFALAISAAITLLICAGVIWLQSRQLTQRIKLSNDLIAAENLDRRRLAGLLQDDSMNLLAKSTRVAERLTNEYEDNPLTRELKDDLSALSIHLRHVINELHPPALAADGLVVALDQLVETFHKKTGIDIWFHEKTDPAELTEAQKTGLYRIAQDALQDIQAGGTATRVEVRLKRSADQYILTVSSNGAKADTKNISPTVKDKAALLNAFIDMVPADDIENGQSLRVRLSV